MLGVIVNTIAVIIGSTVGLIFKKGIPERFSSAIMTGIALCTVYIGISGALKGENTIVLILSMVLGAITGTLLDIDGFLSRLGGAVEKRFSKPGEQSGIARAAAVPVDPNCHEVGNLPRTAGSHGLAEPFDWNLRTGFPQTGRVHFQPWQ